MSNCKTCKYFNKYIFLILEDVNFYNYLCEKGKLFNRIEFNCEEYRRKNNDKKNNINYINIK